MGATSCHDFGGNLRGVLVAAFEKAGIAGPDLERVAVVAASDIRHGDYQSNAAMMLAKVVKKNPRALAEEVLASLEPELAGKAVCSLAGLVLSTSSWNRPSLRSISKGLFRMSGWVCRWLLTLRRLWWIFPLQT